MQYGSAINGLGSLVVSAGSNTVTLTGANTYTGGTTISSGTLQIGAGGMSGSIVGNITNNGAFVFDRSDFFTFSGVISGTGSVSTLQAGGEVNLTGQNTYSGPTTVNGTLAGRRRERVEPQQRDDCERNARSRRLR